MKSALMAFPILALTFVCLSFSQDNPNPVQCAGDSTHQMMPARDGMGKGAGCTMMGDRHGMMGAWMGMRGMREGRMPFRQEFRAHPMRHRIVVIVFLLAMVLVNILLTVLVCMDMAGLGAFSALWIPIILLFGIPGTALYALFRIGDQIKAAAKPRD